MKTIAENNGLAAFLAAATVSAVPYADTVVTFDPGAVAYGYTDGYWTTKKEWRTWKNPSTSSLSQVRGSLLRVSP